MNIQIEILMPILLPPNSLGSFFSNDSFDHDGKPLLKDRNKVGIVKFGSQEVKSFSDKKLFQIMDGAIHSPLLFNLINYCLDDNEEFEKLSKAFSCSVEPHAEIELAEGSFVEFVYPFFLIELEKLAREGVLKQYVRKEDDLVFLKGKIKIERQINNEIKKKPKIACSYFDLTSNIFINQIILAAINKSIKTPRLLDVSSRLLYFQSLFLRENIDSKYFNFHEICAPTHVPKKYLKVFSLAKFILLGNYSNSANMDVKLKCPSFLISPEVVWECFVRSVIRKAFVNDADYVVEKVRDHMRIFDGQIHINEEPDISVSRLNVIISIIDVKYKPSLANADAYQVAAYMGSANIKNKNKGVKGLLIYLGNSDLSGDWSDDESERSGFYILDSNTKLSLKIVFLYNKLRSLTLIELKDYLKTIITQ